MKYRTKPCEIEAIQWTGTNLDEITNFIQDDSWLYLLDGLYIRTLEGDMKANISDYIIRGLRGEYYPCKPDVFEKKYEAIDN